MSEQYISEKLIALQAAMPSMSESEQAKAMDIMAEFGTTCLCCADEDTQADYKERIDVAIGQLGAEL